MENSKKKLSKARALVFRCVQAKEKIEHLKERWVKAGKETEKKETEKRNQGVWGKGIQFIQTKKEKAIEISRVEEYIRRVSKETKSPPSLFLFLNESLFRPIGLPPHDLTPRYVLQMGQEREVHFFFTNYTYMYKLISNTTQFY